MDQMRGAFEALYKLYHVILVPGIAICEEDRSKYNIIFGHYQKLLAK